MRRLLVILLAALLLAACQPQAAEVAGTPPVTVTAAPTVTSTPTLSPQEQREQALRQALGPEVYALLAENNLLDRVDLDRGVLSLPVVGEAEQEYTLPIAELTMTVEQQQAYQQDMLRLRLMFGEENVRFLQIEAQGKGYLYLQDVSFGEGLPKYTGWLEVDLPSDEERNASRPTVEEWLSSFENAQPADYARIPEDPKSREALEFYRANIRENVEAMLALPPWQVLEMKAMLGGVKPGDLVKLQEALGVTDEQVWQIAQTLTGKTQAELSALAEHPAEALEMLARLDGTLQYQEFQKNLEPEFRRVLADDHKKTPEEIEAEVGRIRSQLFGAFSQEELRDLAGKLGMEGAAEAEEGKIIDWLRENYHLLKTTNPFEVQILTKSGGLTTLSVDVLGYTPNVRRLDIEAPDGSIRQHYIFTAYVANIGPDRRGVMPVFFVIQQDMVEEDDGQMLRNFIPRVLLDLRNYQISLVLDVDAYQLAWRTNMTFSDKALRPNYSYIHNLGLTREYRDPKTGEIKWYNESDIFLSGANEAVERIGDVRAVERDLGPGNFAYPAGAGYLMSSYVDNNGNIAHYYDDLFGLDKTQFSGRVFLLWIVGK